MSFLYIVHVVVCVLLIAVILFQDGKTGGLGSIPDASNSVFGAKGASSFLTKLTSGLALLFMVLSLGLAYQNSDDAKSIAADHVPVTTQTTGEITTPADATPAPATEAAAGETGKSIEVDGAKDAVIVKQEDLPEEVRKDMEAHKKREAEKKKKENQQN